MQYIVYILVRYRDKANILIELDAKSLCKHICLLIPVLILLDIPMLIIFMLILIKSKSMLIVYS